MTSLEAFGLLVDFRLVKGLWGDSLRFRFGLAQRSISASLYSSFQDMDSVFSTTSNTRGESGSLGRGVEVLVRGKRSNLPGGAETGRWPGARLINLK